MLEDAKTSKFDPLLSENHSLPSPGPLKTVPKSIKIDPERDLFQNTFSAPFRITSGSPSGAA